MLMGNSLHIFRVLLLAMVPFWAWASEPADRLHQRLAAEPETLMLRGYQGDPAHGISLPKGLAQKGRKSDSGSEYFLLQFDGPLSDTRFQQLQNDGVEFLEYIPNNGYIVRTKKIMSTMKDVRWHDSLRPGYKVEPELLESVSEKGASRDALIIVWQGESRANLVNKLKKIGVSIRSVPEAVYHELVVVRLDADQIAEVAALPEVEWIERAPRITMRNTAETWAVQSGIPETRTIWDRGLHGEGQVIGHIDDPMDLSSCYFRDDSGTPIGPDHRKIVGFRVSGNSPIPHGNHTAGIAAGRNADGSLDEAGHAHAAKITHADTLLIPGVGVDAPSNETGFAGLLDAAQQDGAYIHTNSWGENNRTNYTYLAVASDTFSWLNEDSLILFAATNRSIVYTPENSKNVLAVGATRRPGQLDTKFRAGVGPTADGRRKPEIFAPGENVISAGLGECATAGLSGTSMACPAVAGCAALVRQYFTEGWYPAGEPVEENRLDPSGALLKAMLLNAAGDMTNVPSSDSGDTPPYPNDVEGWGRILLDDVLSFKGEDRRVYTVDARRSRGDGMKSGDSRTYPIVVGGFNQELRVTLAWMGPPVAHNASQAAVNNLNLVVRDPIGRTLLGNVFANGQSTSGGSADLINNVEQVRIPQAQRGLYEVVIEADFVEPSSGTQGYALVVSGGISRTSLVFDRPAFRTHEKAMMRLSVEDFTDPSAVVRLYSSGGDAEMVLLDRLKNDLYAGGTLLLGGLPVPGDGVMVAGDGDILTAEFVHPLGLRSQFATAYVDNTAPTLSGVQVIENFGTSARLRLAMSERVFGAIAGGPAGQPPGITAPLTSEFDSGTVYTVPLEGLVPGIEYTFQAFFQDYAGNTSDGTPPFGFVTRTPANLLATNFEDGEDGFSFSTSLGDLDWLLRETVLARSGGHAMYIQNASHVQDASLLSPLIGVPEKGARLEFWHTYEFDEASYDGGVLEVLTMGASSWEDLGPHILSGGYDGFIIPPVIPNNPLGVDRQAWTEGTLGAMRRVEADLAPFAGGSVRIRWRLGTNSTRAGAGWYVDDVRVYTFEDRPPRVFPGVTGWLVD